MKKPTIKLGVTLLAAAAILGTASGCGTAAQTANGKAVAAASTAAPDSSNPAGTASPSGSPHANGTKGNGSGSNRGPGGGMFNNPKLLSLLQIDQETLMQDIRNGKALVEIGKEHNVTEDQIVEELVQQRVDAAKNQGKTDDEINSSKTEWTTQAKKQAENQMNFGGRGGKGGGGANGDGTGNNQNRRPSGTNGNENGSGGTVPAPVTNSAGSSDGAAASS